MAEESLDQLLRRLAAIVAPLAETVDQHNARLARLEALSADTRASAMHQGTHLTDHDARIADHHVRLARLDAIIERLDRLIARVFRDEGNGTGA